MIRLNLLGDKMDITDLKVTKYVNENLQTIIKTLIEYLEDDNGFTSEDFLPSNNLRISDKVWLELVNDLYYAISSDTIRDFMKPKYEYLLYVILEWWRDCTRDCTDDVNDLIPVKLDASLIDEINIKCTSENGKNYVLSKITDYEEYYYFIFNDFDFLPDNLEKMLLIYLEFPSFFEMLYQDVDLDEYYELMPKDLQERYDEKKKLAIKDEIINIEQMLYEDVIQCCERLQSDRTIKGLLEDEINDRLRNMLDMKGCYYVRNQTRQGCPYKGK